MAFSTEKKRQKHLFYSTNQVEKTPLNRILITLLMQYPAVLLKIYSISWIKEKWKRHTKPMIQMLKTI